MRSLLNLWAACLFCVAALSHAALPAEPLVSRADPNMVIDLALKTPDAGAAYRDAFDQSRIYEGYWDAMGCYDYERAGAYFRRLSSATRDKSNAAIACVNQWSGNLLNWVASSRLDALRQALTGGDRAIDDATHTVLQRAALPANFYRSAHFPDKALSGRLDQLTPLVTGGTEGVRVVDTLHFNNCLERFVVGLTAVGRCDDPGTDQQFGPAFVRAPYFARVEVCTAQDAAARPWLCARQPSGAHKPVGLIQTHAERMRFAVFGYLMDDDPARYGGVLRAPMKYVGPSKIDADFNRVDNPQAEWDAATGVLKPLSSATGSVLLAINRFARTAGDAGAYGSFDPAGEVYYESLRYLQGKPASPEATARLAEGNDSRKGGLPVFNGTALWGSHSQRAGWDPSAGACRRDHIVTIGDLDTQLDRSLPGLARGDSRDDFERAPDPAAFEPDTAAWTRLVGGFENRESLSYAHPSGQSGLTTAGNTGPAALNYKDGTPLSSSNIATLETGSFKGAFGIAGLAYWAHTQRVRDDQPDARVQTYVVDIGADDITGQRRRGSALYLAAKYGGFGDANADGNPFRTSGGEGRPDVAGNAEWAEGLDSDGQPRPANYFSATDAPQLRAALQRVMVRAEAPEGGRSTVGALSSPRVAKAGALLFVSAFSGWRWSGTLLAYPLAHDAGSGSVRRADAPLWDAGLLLTGSPHASPPLPARDPASRRIFTLSSANAGIPFEWPSFGGTQRELLNATPYADPPASDTLGPERVAYLRGDRRQEQSSPGGPFRVRDSVMGDVTHASPLFVPGRGARTATVYVGANDGMLHAFSAASGEELFAYVPRTMFARLAELTSPDYVHRSYVDGAAVAAEVETAGGAKKTVLVAGNGGGAIGVFALDVSDPAAFSAGKVLWEFGAADDTDMGRLTHAPRLLKFRTAAAASGLPARFGWFAVVPSGFEGGNPQQRAALFLLSVDKPTAELWKEGVNYHKIVLPVPADGTRVNALGPPGDEADGDGATRALFAGDTQGNLWKFDFAGGPPWTRARVLGASARPLMVATDPDGRRQPITVAPEVGVGPAGRAVVLFGTGQLASPDDLGRASYRVQSLYAVYDSDPPIPMGEARVQLAPRTATAAGAALTTLGGEAFDYGAFTDKAKGTTRRGWYLDLPSSRDKGEREVSGLVLDNGYLYFNTLMPGASGCAGDGGGRSCAVNALTGLSDGATCVPSAVGPTGPPLLVQAGDSVYGAADAFGQRTETRRLSVIQLGSRPGAKDMASVDPVAVGKVAQTAGRLNWRQLADPRGGRP